MTEGHLRSIVKAITWRILASATTFLIVYIILGNVYVACGVGFLDIIIKCVLYYLHERTWNGISWGRSG